MLETRLPFEALAGLLSPRCVNMLEWFGDLWEIVDAGEAAMDRDRGSRQGGIDSVWKAIAGSTRLSECVVGAESPGS